jgi:hypothetical protein
MKHEVVVAIASLVSVLGGWVLLFWFYRDYRIDKFRQDMFALRDDLFDDAASGLMPFDHPAYGLLRSTMNGFIRFAHKLTLFDILVLSTIDRFSGDDASREQPFSNRLDSSTTDLSDELRKRLISYRRRMNTFLLMHLVLSSPIIVLTFVMPLLGWLAVRFCLDQVMIVLRRQIDAIDSTAFAVGQ